MADSVLGANLGVDLGKTGCRVVLAAGGRRWWGEGRGSAGLAGADGAGRALAAILAVARPVMREAGIAEVAAVGVGAAGALGAPEAARELGRRLCAALPAGRAMVASDAVTSHAGALGGAAGVVLAVGTGAVALGVAADGTVTRAGGWGPGLGDEGGGAWLGQRGIRAAVRAWDGRGPATGLVAAMAGRFGPLPSCLAELGTALAAADGARVAAAFAPDVLAAAAAGDAVAVALVERAAVTLAATVGALGRQGALAVTGGLAVEGLVGPLTRALGVGMIVMPAVGTALEGALRLAVDGGTVHEGALHRVVGGGDGLDVLATEGVRGDLDDLDLRPAGAVVRLVLAAERAAQEALAGAEEALAGAAEAIAARMAAGGRLFTLGAGTPGRLAVLDAAELAPTYSAPPGLVIALLAGGPGAMLEATEGAEDDADAAGAAMDGHGLGAGDAVVGIAASGRTPYVVGGLRHARARGALTVAIVNNAGSPAAAAAELAVEILTGAEVVAGSTRMSAGTTQKIALNAISTAVMVSLGKTYGARMVDVRASNDKLRRRAQRMVQEITGVGPEGAAAALAEAGGRVKPAIVALLAGVTVAEAGARLARAGGRVRAALEAVGEPPALPCRVGDAG